jgi:hypothetical protein
MVCFSFAEVWETSFLISDPCPSNMFVIILIFITGSACLGTNCVALQLGI